MLKQMYQKLYTLFSNLSTLAFCQNISLSTTTLEKKQFNMLNSLRAGWNLVLGPKQNEIWLADSLIWTRIYQEIINKITTDLFSFRQEKNLSKDLTATRNQNVNIIKYIFKNYKIAKFMHYTQLIIKTNFYFFSKYHLNIANSINNKN